MIKLYVVANKSELACFFGLDLNMKNLPPELKNQIVRFTTALSQNYLAIFEEQSRPKAIPAAFNNSPDDYLVGEGIFFGEPEQEQSPEAILTTQSEQTLDKLWAFLLNLKCFTKEEATAMYRLCEKGLQACFRSPTQESAKNLENKLRTAIDMVFPPPPKLSENSHRFHAQKRARLQDKPPIPQPPMNRNKSHDEVDQQTENWPEVSLGCPVPANS